MLLLLRYCQRTTQWGMFPGWCQAEDNSTAKKGLKMFLLLPKCASAAVQCRQSADGAKRREREGFQGEKRCRASPSLRLTRRAGSQKIGELSKTYCSGPM